MIHNFELQEDLERDGFKDFINNNKDIVIFKFGADWCGPCQTIKPVINNNLVELNKFMEKNNIIKNVYYSEIIVDDFFDIYSLFKTKKMVNGIPHMLCYFGDKNNERVNYYVADFSVSGGNIKEINNFFNLIKNNL